MQDPGSRFRGVGSEARAKGGRWWWRRWRCWWWWWWWIAEAVAAQPPQGPPQQGQQPQGCQRPECTPAAQPLARPLPELYEQRLQLRVELHRLEQQLVGLLHRLQLTQQLLLVQRQR